MGIGDDKDFRMVGFQQHELFPGQDHLGGVGSPMLEEITGGPFGGTNFQNPSPPGTNIVLGDNNFTFPGSIIPTVQPPVINIVGGTGGTPTPQLLVDGGGLSPPAPVTQITFAGTALVSVTESGGIATVNYQDTGGGPGGSTLEYGQVTAATRSAGAVTIWTYTVLRYVLGISTSAVTARNLLEVNNTTTASYGYSVVASGNYDRITGTNYFIKSVPVGTWVQMEQTSALPGGSAYWFTAPNRIDGAC
jgi:hypothetical protein